MRGFRRGEVRIDRGTGEVEDELIEDHAGIEHIDMECVLAGGGEGGMGKIEGGIAEDVLFPARRRGFRFEGDIDDLRCFTVDGDGEAKAVIGINGVCRNAI